MSILRYIKTNEKPDIELLAFALKKFVPRLAVEKRGEETYFFWEKNTSAKGIDLTVEGEKWLEARITACSNEDDYELYNYIMKISQELFGGEFYISNPEYDEENSNSPEYIVCEEPFFPYHGDINLMIKDAAFIVAIIQKYGQPITIYGPHRRIHFGPHWLSKLKDHSPFKLARSIEKTILKVNYTNPEYQYGNVMETRGKKEPIKMKLISNQVDCVIDKYDYICFQGEGEEQIAITNDDLNQMLPKAWKRLDEYTIIAPILPENEFEILVKKATAVNKINDLEKDLYDGES